MKVLSVFVVCLVACQGFVIPATTLVRAPSHDSAIIRSDRLGGNFAYSVQEGHAYAAVTPVVQHVATPVAVSYEAPAVRVASPYAYGYGFAAPAIHYGAPAVELVKSAPAVEVVEAAPLPALAAPYFHAVPAALNLKAAVPAGDAPPMSELVQTEKILAPVRAHSKITPEVTVQLPTKVNVEKVAVEVPVAAPYAHPVPVAVRAHHHVGVSTHHHITHPYLF